ncbi:MAG: bifunctional 4-hydroxy-2-oxoglutarate aldolase/2-dehydro-3-deoxy-phosphogluconate aldolase [Thermoanaerobaculaceae bacterium]|nr:bifunctional 4-hydroxy-2-oxoglutarate aldolase/2-dehydro-3-deoxy-phosphogluconate aldolase [Thermoanaerobaculaceae bacterium]
MGREHHVQWIERTGLIAIVRLDSPAELVQAAKAIALGGVSVIEFTLTTPGALRTIEEAVKALGRDVLIGAGTVLDAETARAAILAGAEFVVAPTLNTDVIEMCHRYDKVVIPGAYTPTEILTAWEHGADFVKLFPAEVGGPAYLKAVRAPLPQVKLIPVGGVSLETAKAFLRAGAAALGVGSNLVDKKAVAEGRFTQLTTIAQALSKVVDEARRGD